MEVSCVTVASPSLKTRGSGIHGYLSSLSRPEQVVYFFRQVVGIPVVSKETLSERTGIYQKWVDGYARNQQIPIEWAEKKVRKEDYVLPHLRRMEGGCLWRLFHLQEHGASFRITVPKYATKDPNHRILARQKTLYPLCTFTYATRSLVRW
jgi:hypothetical protein